MSNTTSGRVSPAQFAFYLGFVSLLCFGLVAFHVLPIEPGWSARVTSGVLDTVFAGVVLLVGALGLGLIAVIRSEARRAAKTLALFGRPGMTETEVPKQLKVLSALDVVSFAVAVLLTGLTLVLSVPGMKEIAQSALGDGAPVSGLPTVLGTLSVTAYALNYVIKVQLSAQRRVFFESLLRANR